MIRLILRPVSFVGLLLWITDTRALVQEQGPRTTSTQQPSPLFSRKWRPHMPENDRDPDRRDDGRAVDDVASSLSSLTLSRLANDRPTQTLTDMRGPPTVPDKPKIVVLGATGKIGRTVVRQLLESNIDATIVAFCRDYDKACRVLYDDLLVLAKSNPRRKRGPKLQIVQGDLVPPEELPGYNGDETERAEWLKRAASAAKFFKNSISDYDDGADDQMEDDSNESLEEAIRGCTTIISCVGSVRPTNLWKDLLERPLWRLLRRDVSDWCNDSRHPYYVHYASTRKALAFAEREQLRREAAASADLSGIGDLTEGEEEDPVPRIRFIRISDLCVSQQPWHFIPLLTNVLHSMVFRYQDMAEKLLEASPVIESIVLRPGDLVDDERDVNTTSLQVGIDGHVPGPARVGREDVAALAIAAALFDSSVLKRKGVEKESSVDTAFHHTLAVRWCGDKLEPYPSQGSVGDGLPDANICMQSALRSIRKREKRKRHRQLKKEKVYPESVLRFARSVPSVRRKTKPYGICVAVPVYLSLMMMAKTLFLSMLPYLPGRSWMIPAASRVGGMLTMMGAFVLTRIHMLMDQLPAALAWIPRRGARKYITF